MVLDKISQNLLSQISNLHEIPDGAVSFRKNGKGEIIRSTANIEIAKKDDASGIDIFVHSSCQGEACHIPVVVSENGLFDLVYNDFYIEDNADVAAFIQLKIAVIMEFTHFILAEMQKLPILKIT